MMRRILLLGSGELGGELVISAQCKDQHIIAYDSYAEAPAMQVADEFEVFDMLSGKELERVAKKHRPDIIVPEIEVIRTERLHGFEKGGIQVVPSVRAVNPTVNRKTTRNLAVQELGLKTAKYFYAKTLEELKEAADKIGFPCVVKPLMFSPDKGQSLVKSANKLEHAWEYGYGGSRGDIRELITEEFIEFDSEVTPLTVIQKNDPTLFYPSIGHVQKGSNYRESFQPAHVGPTHLKGAKETAEKVTRALAGARLWGVGSFLGHDNGVYFSELFPRPHDTGMATLADTRNLGEFELHLRAILDLSIPGIKQERVGTGAMILSPIASRKRSQYHGLEEVTKEEDIYLHIFGKSFTHANRRMDVILCCAPPDPDLDTLRDKAKGIAEKIEVH